MIANKGKNENYKKKASDRRYYIIYIDSDTLVNQVWRTSPLQIRAW